MFPLSTGKIERFVPSVVNVLLLGTINGYRGSADEVSKLRRDVGKAPVKIMQVASKPRRSFAIINCASAARPKARQLFAV